MRIISARPDPDFSCLKRAFRSDIKLDEGLTFFEKGRHALVYGLEKLNISPEASILVPAYMCHSTIAPLKDIGYKIIFFDIQEDLNCDLKMVEHLLKKYDIAAMLSVHYYGYPSNVGAIVKLCNQYNVKVIEDCSHSFLTQIKGESIGSLGHIAIYSMRKTLPVPDGGALRFNVEMPLSPAVMVGNLGWHKEILYLVSRMLESMLCFIGFLNLYSTNINSFKNSLRSFVLTQNQNDNVLQRDCPIQASFQLKAYLYDKNYQTHVAKIRSRNYLLMAKEINQLGFRIIYPDLPNGCVPQYLVVKDKTKRLTLWLREQGIGAASWPGPELPQEVANRQVDFPVTNSLNDHLVMLPIHQSLNDSDILKMIDLLKKWVTI